MTTPNHLIIVCGHAIWLGGPQNGHDESEWLIESYKKGETPIFIEHIRTGVKALSEDDRSVLVFSGGPTRKETCLSEGESYKNLAQANSYFAFLPDNTTDPVSTCRILVEDRALDSYYNILFSMILFWRVHHDWPEHLTIVSHGFKRTRLVDLHCSSLGYPLCRITFLGTHPPQTSAEKDKVMAGILEAEKEWSDDPHGVGENLALKRRKRNAWSVDQKLFVDEEERRRSGLKTDLLHDGTETLVWTSQMPW